METELREDLLSASDENELRDLIAAHDLTYETVEALKSHSATFYFDRPNEALRVAEIAQRLGNLLSRPASALGDWALANAYMFIEHFQAAVDLFDQARAVYLAEDRPLDAARMGVGHVWALAYTGQFERALALAAEIEPVLIEASRENSADYRRLGGLFNNVGIAYELLGQYEEALAAYDQKLVIARDQNKPLDVARTQHNRACALTYLNDFDEALAAFRNAEVAFREAEATADLARLAYNRGTLYAQWGRYQDAETELAAADTWLRESKASSSARAALTVYRALAHLAYNDALDEKLYAKLRETQPVLTTHGPRFEEGLAWLAVGRHLLASGELSQADEAFGKVQTIAEAGGGLPLMWQALRYLGILAERCGEAETAMSYYQQAIEHVEALRRRLYVGAFRAGFLTDKLSVYGDLALLQAQQGRLEAAFATVERAKSRLLVERMVYRLHNKVAELMKMEDSHFQDLAQRLQHLLARLDDLDRQARLEETGERGAWTAVPNPETLQAVTDVEQQVQGLTRQIEREYPRVSSVTTDEAGSLQRVQAQLSRLAADRPESTLLQYHIARGRVRVFVVNREGIRDYHDLASLSDVEAARQRFSAAIERALGLNVRYGREMLTRYLPALLADVETHLTTLYDHLMRPLAITLSTEDSLIISPAGALHYVPFHALYDGAAYVIERCEVSYTPSATVLDLCEQNTSDVEKVLVMGYGGEGLEHIITEAEATARIFSEVDLVHGEAATAKRLLREGPKCRLLHLAAHAHFRADNTMLSAFSLADRRLTLAEILRLGLSTELVTLSACETGHGRLYGNDLISLACGFLGAGARSLLVSLWRVDDPITASLMKTFYQALQNGYGRAAALRKAQLALLTQGREQEGAYGFYRHPAYWAPFTLIGESGKLPGVFSDIDMEEDDRCVS